MSVVLPGEGRTPRLLFCSYHSYLDPTSGAALATRDLFEHLVARGWDCGVLCGPELDFEQPTPFEQLLAIHRLPYHVQRCAQPGLSFALFHFTLQRVPVSLYQPDDHRPHQPPAVRQGKGFLEVFDRLCETFRPDVLLTYGGRPLAPHLMGRARGHGLKVVFAVHNLTYTDRDFFAQADAVVAPSRSAQEHYRRHFSVDTVALSWPWDAGRVLAESHSGRFITFVNPQPAKGAFWFARIASEMSHRRPEIPFLVVEGRGGVDWLRRVPLDLSGLRNLHRMANTPFPRDFYSQSRAVLMPSLVPETFGRVAAESLANGVPVLASRRGALPETLAEAGFLFDIPAEDTPTNPRVPTAAEVSPWLDTLERLWDNPDFYAEQQRRCREAARVWDPRTLVPRFEAFFRDLVNRPALSATNDVKKEGRK